MNQLEQLKERTQDKSFQESCDIICHDLHQIPHYNWVGIYLVEGEDLVLGAWNGPEATEHIRIPIGQGFCGLAVAEKRTVIVDDVNADPRYLACFPQTKAEIVVPVFTSDGSKVIGEIDIDSDTPAAFNDEDAQFLKGVARLIAERFER